MADAQANINVNLDTSQALAQLRGLQRQISLFQQQMARGNANTVAQAQGMQRNLLNSINATGQFSARMTTVSTATESFTNALEKNKFSMGEYFRYAGGASKKFGRFFKNEMNLVGKVARERVKDLQTQYIKMGRDTSGAMKGMAVRPLTLDMENYATKTAVAAQKQQIFNQLIRQGSTNLLNWGKNTQWAGRQLMVGFTIPLSIMGATAISEFRKLEEQAVKFRRVYGDMFTTSADTEKALNNIRELADEFTKYGIAVEKTIDLAAKVAQMGNMGDALEAQVTQATRLAVLGGLEQQEALDTTISLTNAFGVATEDLADKISFLNAAENQTILAIEDFNEAIPKAGSVVQQLGGDVEDLAFFLTAMREGGINASQGANALKSSLGRLVNPTEVAKNKMAELGIDIVGIVENNVGDLRGTIMELGHELDDLAPLDRSRAIEQMFGKFQFARMSTMFQNIVKDGSQAQKVLELTTNSSEELAILAERELARVEESPAFKLQKSFEQLKASLAPLGEQFIKIVTPIIEFGTDILKKFDAMGEGGKRFATIAVSALGLVAPAALMIIGLIANGVANLAKFFQMMLNVGKSGSTSMTQLGAQTQYMTQEQIEANAVAASLNNSHERLRQTFTSEAAAVRSLTTAYQQGIGAQRAFAFGPARGGMRGGSAPRFAKGVVSVPGPKGAGDIIPAMLSPGEAVIPAEMARKYSPLINEMIEGNIPGYVKGVNLSDLGLYSAPSTIKSQTTAMPAYSTEAAENEFLEQLAKERGLSQSQLRNLQSRQASHITPDTRRFSAGGKGFNIKQWFAKNLMMDKGVINNFSNNLVQSTDILDDFVKNDIGRVSKKLGMSVGDTQKVVDKFKKGMAPTTKQEAMVMREVAASDAKRTQEKMKRALRPRPGDKPLSQADWDRLRRRQYQAEAAAGTLGIRARGNFYETMDQRSYDPSKDKQAQAQQDKKVSRIKEATKTESESTKATKKRTKATKEDTRATQKQTAAKKKSTRQAYRDPATGRFTSKPRDLSNVTRMTSRQPILAYPGGVPETSQGPAAPGRFKRFMSVGRGGGGMGIAMAGSSIAMGASMLPGEAGKAAQGMMPAIMALSMLPIIISTLGAAMTGVVAVIGAVVAGFIAYNNAMDKAYDQAFELNRAMGTGKDAMQEFANFAGTVSAGEVLERRRQERLSPYVVQPGKTTFGSAFVASEEGDAFVSNVRKSIEKLGRDQAIDKVFQQLGTAVSQNILTAEQARSIAGNLGIEMGDLAFSAEVNGKLIKLLGANGENLLENPLEIPVVMAEMQARSLEEDMAKYQEQRNILSPEEVGALESSQRLFSDINKYTSILGGPASLLSLGTRALGTGVDEEYTQAIEAEKQRRIDTGEVDGWWQEMLLKLTPESVIADEIMQSNLGVVSANLQNSLEQQQSVIDGIRLASEEKIAKAIEEGADYSKVQSMREEEADAINEAVEKIREQTQTSIDFINSLSAKDQIEVQKQQRERILEAAPEDVDKGTLGASFDKLFETGAFDINYTLSSAYEAGEFSLSDFKYLSGLDAEQKEIYFDISTNLGAGEAGQIIEVAQLIKDEDVKGEFELNFKGLEGEELKEAISQAEQIAQFSNMFSGDLTLPINFMVSEPEKMESFMSNLEEFSLKAQGGGFDANVELMTEIFGAEQVEAAQKGIIANQEEFDALPDEMQLKYGAYFTLFMDMAVEDGEMMALAEAATGLEGEAAVAAFIMDYLPAMGPDMTTGGDGEETPTPSGGGGAPDTSWLDKIVKQVRDVNSAQQELTQGFDSSLAALENFANGAAQGFDGLANQLRGINVSEALIEKILGLSPEEWEEQKDQIFQFDIAGNIAGLTAAGQAIQDSLNIATIGSFISEQDNITISVNNQIVALNKLTSAGASYEAAYRAVQNTALAAAIATARSSREIQAAAEAAMRAQEMMDKFEEINEEEQRRKGIRDAVRQTNREFAEQAKILDYINRNRSRLNDDQISELLSDKNLRSLALEPNIDPGALKTALENARKKADLELRVQVTTEEGKFGLFDEMVSEVMSFFSRESEKININFELNTLVDDSLIREVENQIASMQFMVDDYEAQLREIENAEEEINTRYEKRFEALDKIATINDRIAAQQQNQISLAEALSSGDIAAAAQAAQQMREQESADNVETQREILEQRQQAEIDSLRSASGLSRKNIEEKIKELEDEIFRLEEERIEPAQERIRLAEYDRDLQIASLEVSGKTRLEWEQISNLTNIAAQDTEEFAKNVERALALFEYFVNNVPLPLDLFGGEIEATLEKMGVDIEKEKERSVVNEVMQSIDKKITTLLDPEKKPEADTGLTELEKKALDIFNLTDTYNYIAGLSTDQVKELQPGQIPLLSAGAPLTPPVTPGADRGRTQQFDLNNMPPAGSSFLNPQRGFLDIPVPDWLPGSEEILEFFTPTAEGIKSSLSGFFNNLLTKGSLTVSVGGNEDALFAPAEPLSGSGSPASESKTLPTYNEQLRSQMIEDYRKASRAFAEEVYGGSLPTGNVSIKMIEQSYKRAIESTGRTTNVGQSRVSERSDDSREGGRSRRQSNAAPAPTPSTPRYNYTPPSRPQTTYNPGGTRGSGFGMRMAGGGYVARMAMGGYVGGGSPARMALGGVVPYTGKGGSSTRMAMGGKVKGYPMGGLIPYKNNGGFFKSLGSDTVPAMLTPGEFVIRRPAVSGFGIDNLEKINRGTYNDGSVYNYNLAVNVKSDSNPEQIANTVMREIKRVDSQRIRNNRY